jgi:hypothetical protein
MRPHQSEIGVEKAGLPICSLGAETAATFSLSDFA